MKNTKKALLTGICALILSLCHFNLQAQLAVSTSMTPQQLVQNVLVGNGVTVSNIVYSGVSGSIGEFTNGNTTNLGLTSGIVISTGRVNATPAIGSPASNFASTDNGSGSDPQLQSLVSATVEDASVLQFDFNPIADTIKFRYVFGSEEYPEFVNSGYNDVFGFFVSGPNPAGGNYTNYNIARIPGTTLPVTIDNVNSGSYSQFYVNNGSGVTIVYDGFTTVLTAWCRVVPCNNYHIKIAIGDAGDGIYDSGVFLEANSFSSNGISYNTSYTSNIDTVAVEGCNNAIISFILNQPATDTLVIHYNVTGDAVEGVDYPSVPDSLIIFPGQDSAAFLINPIADGLNEPTEAIYIAYVNTVCGSLDTIVILVKDYTPITTTTVPDVFSCNGQQANIGVSASGGYPPLGYLWSSGAGATANVVVNPPNPTMYYVTVSDACNYFTIDSVKVSISNLSSVISGVDSITCYGYNDGTATVTASNGILPYSYIWSPTNDQTPTTDSLGAGTYFVTVTDGIGCQTTNYVILSSPPQLTLTLTPTDESCFYSCNGRIDASIAGNLTSPVTYSWNTSPPQQTQNAVNLCPGTYNLTVTYSPNNCLLTGSAIVGTNTLVDASFATAPNPPEGFVPFEVQFTFTGYGAASYFWEFGDGATSTLQNPTHTYTSNGEYIAKLTITSGAPDNCQDVYSMTITAIQPSSMTIPNVFTPNGDGINDQFCIESEGIKTFKIAIYNRWGKKVHEMQASPLTESFARKEIWDGTSNGGAKCAAGTYFYVLEAEGFDKKVYNQQGTINLVE